MSSSTSGYSLPSSHVTVRLVSIGERLRIAKSALLSLKTTGLYSGCMPFFIWNSFSRLSKPYSLTTKTGRIRECRTLPAKRLAADALYLAQELGVGAGLFELLDQQLYLLAGVQGVQDAPHLPDPLGLGRLHEQLLLARRGVVDVDVRVDPAVRQLALEVDLHVARALELLVDDLVHPAPGLHERARKYRQRPAVLDVPRSPEEPLGWVERRGVHTTGEDPAARRRRQVEIGRA